MSRRIGLLRTRVVGAALIGAGFVSTHAIAQEFYAIDPHVRGCCEGGIAPGANAWTNGNYTSAKWPEPPPVSPDGAHLLTGAVPVAGPVPYWWTHGAIEFGYRAFTNGPSRDGAVYVDQKSLAKYYEYSTIAPGAFGGGHVAAGSVDGLYQADIWANNVGYSDESYWLYASKAGEHYISAGWDQSPHVYSTSAQTPFLGVGTSTLTLPANFPAGITSPSGILPVLHQQDIEIERNTASVAYRWTPTEAWDIRADYSHMTRTGSQVAGIVELNGFMPTEVPAPVKDATQNFGANGEYAGFSPWGQKYTVKVAYSGSQYTDSISSYFVQNPFFPTLGSCAKPTAVATAAAPAGAAGTANCVSAQMSTPPSNSANGVSGTVAADLPLLSRYVGTVNYTMMRQNELFQPMTDNPNAVASPFNGGANWNTLGALPTTSLNGAINTLLSNNVVTTKILPDLTSKLSYRYYNFDNQTPREIFPCWISYDGTGVPITKGNNACGGATAAGTGFEIYDFELVDRLRQAGCRCRAELAAVPGMEFQRRVRLRALQLHADRRQRYQRKFRKGFCGLEADGLVYRPCKRRLRRSNLRELQLPAIRAIHSIPDSVPVHANEHQLDLCPGLPAIHVRPPSTNDSERGRGYRGISWHHCHAHFQIQGRQLRSQSTEPGGCERQSTNERGGRRWLGRNTLYIIRGVILLGILRSNSV